MKVSIHPILVLIVLLSAAAPLAVSAAEPNGDWVRNDSSNAQGSQVGVLSSAIIQNGQFIGSGDNIYNIDQTNAPGSRADAVQAIHAAEGRGRDK